MNTLLIIEHWGKFLQHHNNWEKLIAGIQPKKTGCGLIYELGQPLDRPSEDLAIADMSGISHTQPHYHLETEIYFVLQGRGVVVVGEKEETIQQGSIILVPPTIAHYTIPKDGLIIAVVATPPYNPRNTVPLYENNERVQFDFEQFIRLTMIDSKSETS